MNIFKPQKPYVFHPPRYTPWLEPVLIRVSRGYMRNKFKVRDIAIEGDERVAELARAGHSLLVAPNHADHADPHVLLHAGRRRGMHFHFMAAREGFEKTRLAAFVLQRMGAFSVDREGADVSAIKTAMQIVSAGKYPLVIFPEGEIYHHHERLDDLNEGVATILLRASTRVATGRRCYALPTAIRYTYDPCVAETFSERMDRLETRIGWKPRPEIETVERIYRLGRGLLALKEEEYLGHAQTGKLVERIGGLQEKLVASVEETHGSAGEGHRVPERIKWLRGRIRKELTDEDAAPGEERQRELYDHLDTLFAAAQLYSYPGQYLREQPSVHRIAETILKLEEDVLLQGSYPVPQDVHIRFGEPIDVASFMEEGGLDVKSAVAPITERVGRDIQAMLRELG